MKQFALFFAVLTLLEFNQVQACNTNSGMHFDELNRNGNYSFTAYKNGTGQVYNTNMRISWNFGDGNSGTGQTTHTYTNFGKYTIILYLWDSTLNCGDTVYGSLCYFHPQLNPVMTKSNDTLFASANCDSNWKYSWIFDDNTFGRGCSVAHKYKKGFYMPILQMVEDTVMGCEDSILHTFKVFDFTRCGIDPNFSIYFTTMNLNHRAVTARPLGRYTNLSGKSGKSVWTWGDNTSTTTMSVPSYEALNHLYQVAGTYTIAHIVTDSAGTCTDTSRFTFYVDSCDSDADFSYTITGNIVAFKARATSGALTWSFGGGSGSSTTSFRPTVTYSGTGSYNVCLENLSNDCSKKICKSIVISNCGLLGNYSYSIDTTDCLKVHFSQTSNQPNLKFKWDFGDSTASNAKNPSHTYSGKGTYQVKLWAIDTTNTCRDSAIFSLPVSCPCNVNDSLVLYYDSTTPYQAILYNYSSGPIHKHYWDFGDSTNSSSASPTHSYTITGRVCVTYIATDTVNNCSDTAVLCFTIDSSGNIKRGVFLLMVITPGQTSMEQRIVRDDIVVYPNPFSEGVAISGLAAYGKYELELLDAMGRKVIFGGAQEGDIRRVTFQENIASGLYILRIRTDTGVTVYKLYKQ